MKNYLSIALIILTCVATGARAASVGPTGYFTDLTAQPPASDWSTVSRGTSATAITTPGALDTAARTNVASAITAQCNSSNANPPNAVGPAVWSTSGYLQTRPTGNAFTLLMASLVNATGSNVAAVNLSYSFTTNNPNTEEVPGQRVYYSLTGNAGSWTLVPEISSVASGTLNATLNIAWADGSPLYLLFADDNGSGTPDTACQIDNFSVTTAGGGSTVIVINSPTEGQNIVEGANFAVTATTAGTITDTAFYLDGALVGMDTTSPYSVTYSNVALGPHTLTAVANGSVTSAPVHITIVANNPPTVAVTSAPSGTVLVGSNIVNTATVTDPDPGGSTRQVEFYLDGVLKVTDTTSPYTYDLCDVLPGTYTIMAVAVDQAGARGTNFSTVTATNPTDVAIIIPNGSTWQYLDKGTDPRTNTPPWPGLLFDASSWSNGVAELGYGDASNNNRPETTTVGYGTNASAKYATTYFRKAFNLADVASITNLIIRILRDDGAIVYLNGVEVFRTAITNAVVDNSTYTPPAVADDGTFYQVTNIAPPYPYLVAGANVVDVEIHQDAATSTDISFDLMLWSQPGSPKLTITRLNDTQADLAWPFPSEGFVLEFENQLDNSWAPDLTDVDVPSGGMHHVTVNTSSGKRFFRLRHP